MLPDSGHSDPRGSHPPDWHESNMTYLKRREGTGTCLCAFYKIAVDCHTLYFTDWDCKVIAEAVAC